MAAPRPRPPLQVIRDGNPGKRPVREGVKLAPTDLTEPDWSEVFDTDDPQPVVVRLRAVASREWVRVAPALQQSAGLNAVDTVLLTDYCVCVARIDQGERALTRDGALVQGERGWQKSGWTTIVAQYRTQLRAYIVELGLSPSSRAKLAPPKGDDDDDPFD